MATYVYKCDGCNHELEIKQSMRDAPITRCPACSQDKLRRVIQASPTIFKGRGWTPKMHRRR